MTDVTTAFQTSPRAAGQPEARRPRIVVANRYEVEVERPLGTGGMATVYRGRDLRMRRDVALKSLRAEYRADPDTRTRFRREARTMAFVNHPNLARLYDLHDEGEVPWIVMEYIPGPSLKQIVAERGPLPPAEVAAYLDQLAGALAAMHGRDFVHLDVKPQNVLVPPDGPLKLIDFGLAQRIGASPDVIGGTTFGTVAYLAPEQARGGRLDEGTDVYALGCVVYELLTGRPPFGAEVAGTNQQHKREIIHAHLHDPPVPPTQARPDLNLPDWVDDVVGWALAKRPDERFRDVVSFAQVFRAGVSGTDGPIEQLTEPLDFIDAPLPLDATGRLARPTTPGPGRRSAAKLYRVGGRAARGALRFRRTLWRLLLILVIGNLLLALVLLAEGGPTALVQRLLAIAPGTTAEVSVDGLRLRETAGTAGTIVVQLGEGDRVQVTGLPETVDGDRWWPVAIERDGQTVQGYAWAEGLEPTELTGRLSWLQDTIDRGAAARDTITDTVDGVRGVIP